MTDSRSTLPPEVADGYWAEVQRVLRDEFQLSQAQAEQGLTNYRAALHGSAVGDLIYHAPPVETAEGIVQGGYVTTEQTPLQPPGRAPGEGLVQAGSVTTERTEFARWRAVWQKEPVAAAVFALSLLAQVLWVVYAVLVFLTLGWELQALLLVLLWVCLLGVSCVSLRRMKEAIRQSYRKDLEGQSKGLREGGVREAEEGVASRNPTGFPHSPTKTG